MKLRHIFPYFILLVFGWLSGFAWQWEIKTRWGESVALLREYPTQYTPIIIALLFGVWVACCSPAQSLSWRTARGVLAGAGVWLFFFCSRGIVDVLTNRMGFIFLPIALVFFVFAGITVRQLAGLGAQKIQQRWCFLLPLLQVSWLILCLYNNEGLFTLWLVAGWFVFAGLPFLSKSISTTA